MLAAMFLIAVVVFLLGYKLYGQFMSDVYELDDKKPTPAVEINDGLDYCPAHPSVLLGHHFASIAGGGPIVGPIAAAAIFGWLPAFIWCLLGSVFLGGPHDMGSIVASMRHEGKSIGEVVDRWIGRRAKMIFLCFTWLSLMLVVAVFLQLSANTFAADPVVAFAGTLYILMALIFGVLVYRYHVPLWAATVVMVPIVFGAVWYGTGAEWVASAFSLSMESWRIALAGYVFFASILPVWLLLQPRDYLASYLLYFAVGIGSIGMLFGGSHFPIVLPAFTSFAPEQGMYLWPLLFVMIACGAISGFHSMVGSGTTSKQLRKETDAKLIGYGSMLLEGLVAIIALGTIMIIGTIPKAGPVAVFGEGFGKFWSLLGLDPRIGTSMGLLAINSFLLTSLDTATRLGRYQLQELTNMKLDRYSATVVGVVGALALLYLKSGDVPAWKMIWPVFGASNQLVAALALLTLTVWVSVGLKKNASFLRYPMYFMVVTTCGALVLLIQTNLDKGNYFLVAIGVVLLVLAVMLIVEAFRALKRSEPAA